MPGELSLPKWSQGLITKLLVATHSQWLYRNIHVHNSITGTLVTTRKEELEQFIED